MRLRRLVRKYGRDVFTQSVEEIFTLGEAKARAALSRLPSGEHTAMSFLDDDGIDVGRPVELAHQGRYRGPIR